MIATSSSLTVRRAFTVLVALAVGFLPPPSLNAGFASSYGGQAPPAAAAVLTANDLWLVPSPEMLQTRTALARAVTDLAEERAEAALRVFAQATRDPILGGHALLYVGRAQLALGRSSDALFSARQVLTAAPTGRLAEAAHLLSADAAEAAADWPAVVTALQSLAAARPLSPSVVHLRLGRAAVQARNRPVAVQAFNKVYYEYPLTPEATEVEDDLARLVTPALVPTRESYALSLGRAERFYGARRYADARNAFVPLKPLASSDDRPLIELRLAQCDFQLKRYPAARDALREYLDNQSTRLMEARYFYIGTFRELRLEEEYLAQLWAFVNANPAEPLAESALNDLGTYYILKDEDGKAAEVFAEQYRRFPRGASADRAAWKAGWWAYKSANYAETARLFEEAAISMRRANYRPSWLYWAARSHEQLGRRDLAIAGFRQVIADYRNSFYGRQATRKIEETQAALRTKAAGPVSPARRELPASIVPGTAPPNATLIRHLLAAGMYDDAIAEVRRVQVDTGSSPLLEATLAFALNRKGDLRPSINTMRGAYPQFMASGGEALPVEILTTIFPVEYWALIHKYATSHGLDPYLMTALVAQESTFQADVRSVANAYGLMQVIPGTGRRYAQTLGIRPFRTARLTEPEVNVRIGMAYFADLMRQFGDVAPALAAYNAGEHRVAEWLAERPGLARDEFIDDIPFPETQNYVKRVVGTAEDYRLLYRDLTPVIPVRR